jgi:Peptidase inhibitor I78 family
MHVRAASVVGLSLSALLMIACSGRTDLTPSPMSVERRNGIGSTAPGDRGPAPLPKPIPRVSSSCDASKTRFAMGMRASTDLLDRARIEAQAGSARFVRPGDRLTMEFLPSRLNVHLDAQDVVVSATCG